MARRARLVHLLMVPVITIIVCNGLAGSLLWQLSASEFMYFKLLATAVTALYGLYLYWLRRQKEEPGWHLLALGAGATALAMVPLPSVLWLLGSAVLFSMMRIILTGAAKASFAKDLLVVIAGLAVAVFMLPASLAAAVAGFLLVQMIYDLGHSLHRTTPTPRAPDRFHDGLRTAERVLTDYSLKVPSA